MKNTLILLTLLIALAGLYFFVINPKSNEKGSISIEDRSFMVESSDDIEVLTVKNPGYPMMHFARQKDGTWLLNNRYKTDENIISNMIGVLEKMEIKYIPPKTMLPRILGELDKVGIEIKSYDKDGNLISDFIMGSNDNRELSTFCVQRGAKQAYAMHVSVTEGGLRNYFSQPQRDLRDKAVIDMNPKKIQSFEMQYPKDRGNSFKIKKEGNKYSISALESFNSTQGSGNDNIIRSYLLDHEKVYAEAIRTGEVSMDSIRNLIPFAKIHYTLNDNTYSKLDFYPMKDLLVKEVNTQSYRDLEGIERYFVFDDKGEVYIVQHRMVKTFFRPLEYFYN